MPGAAPGAGIPGVSRVGRLELTRSVPTAQSIVAPMASLTLVANVIFAPLIHGERVTRSMLVWTGVIIMGCALSVVFAQHQDCRTRAAGPPPCGPVAF